MGEKLQSKKSRWSRDKGGNAEQKTGIASFMIYKGKRIGVASCGCKVPAFKSCSGGPVALVIEDEVQHTGLVRLKTEGHSVGQTVLSHESAPRQVFHIPIDSTTSLSRKSVVIVESEMGTAFIVSGRFWAVTINSFSSKIKTSTGFPASVTMLSGRTFSCPKVKRLW